MNNDEQDLLADLLVKWEEEFDQGHDVPAAELCTDHPHLTTELQTKIDGLKQTAWLKKDAGRPLTDRRETKNFAGLVLSNRYRLDEVLGQGCYGQVYRGFDLQLQRAVAVKIGHARTTCDLLLDEARKVAKLKHNCIVGVYDCCEHEGRMILVFELVEGRSLAEVVRTKKLSVKEAVILVATVAEALHTAHKQGCIHRDIKPENILIDNDGQPKVADFGVSCTLEEIQKGRSVSSGTLGYMAPEQIAQETQLLDGRCDVHALGVLLFELLTGRSPFEARTPEALREQILFRQPTLLRVADSSLPQALEVICNKALQKHPGDRFQSAEVMANELRSWLERDRKQRRWLMRGLVLLVLLVGGAVIAWNLLGPSTGRDSAIHFDGHTRITTPVERKLPVTLEAWVKPDPYRGSDCQFVIGSDVPTKYGVGIGICGSVLSAEYIGGMINTPIAVPPVEWSHITGVFTEAETRLYLNGKLVHTGPGGANDSFAKFVLGNVGLTNPIAYFKGDLRSVRISQGERYRNGFKPDDDFSTDAETLVIYEPKRTVAGTVRDLSGRGNDGHMEVMTEPAK